MKIQLIIVFISSLVLTTATSTPAQPANSRQSLTHAGLERTFWLQIPDSAPADDRSAIIALHPSASSGRAMQLLTGLDSAAAKHGFVTVYPDSAEITWSENATDIEVDDVGFLTELIEYLTAEHEVNQVYLTGFGNGGLMAYHAACEIPQFFSGIVVVGALMWDYHRDNCPEAAPASVNLLVLLGTNDHFYKFETRDFSTLFGNNNYVILGVEDTMDFWAQRQACEGAPQSINENTTQLNDCADETTVAMYRILGGGQNWPRTGDYTLNQFGVDANAIIIDFFTGADSWATPQPEPYAGQARTYTTYIPANYDPTEPAPVVIGLHGRFGTGAGHASLTDTNRLADEKGFIAVYPDGLSRDGSNDTGWNYFKGAGFFRDEGVDDTAFITTLMDDLALDLNIDRERIYVNGLSNGGFMVHRLACEAPEVFAGYADIAGSGFQGLETVCDYEQRKPVRMLIIHGTQDNNVLWDGRLENIRGQQFYSVLPIPQMLGFWAEYNQCAADADTRDIPPQGRSPGTQVRILTVKDCQEESAVVLYAIVGGGHNWPGVPGRIPEPVAGRVNLDIHATDVMWAFFTE